MTVQLTFSDLRRLVPQAHIEEVILTEYPYDLSAFEGLLQELWIYTGLAFDPFDAEGERLIWSDICDDAAPAELAPSTFTELKRLFPQACIEVLHGSQYPNPTMFEGLLPELQVYTGWAIDPTDPEGERLVWFEPNADPGRFARRVPFVLREAVHPSIREVLP